MHPSIHQPSPARIHHHWATRQPASRYRATCRNSGRQVPVPLNLACLGAARTRARVHGTCGQAWAEVWLRYRLPAAPGHLPALSDLPAPVAPPMQAPRAPGLISVAANFARVVVLSWFPPVRRCPTGPPPAGSAGSFSQSVSVGFRLCLCLCRCKPDPAFLLLLLLLLLHLCPSSPPAAVDAPSLDITEPLAAPSQACAGRRNDTRAGERANDRPAGPANR